MEFKNLDESRFLFNSRTVFVREGDTAGGGCPIYASQAGNEMVTFSRFSEVEYYYNFNNILIGVCHVPN